MGCVPEWRTAGLLAGSAVQWNLDSDVPVAPAARWPCGRTYQAVWSPSMATRETMMRRKALLLEMKMAVLFH